MKPIGGYLELQLRRGREHYPQLIKLNTGRNAFEYLLKVRQYRKVYLPYFTCEVLLEPLKKLGIAWQYYHIDKQLEPVINFQPGEGECFLYTNYFGLKQATVLRLSKQFPALIADHSQAFFCPPVADTFYSCRKFFGVADGAYLHAPGAARPVLKRDHSLERFSHLIASIDSGIERGYQAYVDHNHALSNNPVRRMSALSERILSSIDYQECKEQRNTNFMYLHAELESQNQYPVAFDQREGPMVYPFLHPRGDIRKMLLKEKVFVPTYWPNVLEWTTPDMFEHYLTTNLVALPVDHRYTVKDMKRILRLLNKCL